MDSIELSDGRTIKCIALSKDEYESKLKEKVEDVKDYLSEGIIITKIKSGEFLVESEGYYTLYFNLEEIKSVIANAGFEGNSHQVLLNKNSYGAQFPSNVESLVKQLITDLALENTNVDSISLYEIDKSINALAEKRSDFDKNHLIHYIALIGKQAQLKYHAEWKMELADDGVTWNPCMVLHNQRFEFFTYLYEDIFLQTRELNLLSDIYSTVENIMKANIK